MLVSVMVLGHAEPVAWFTLVVGILVMLGGVFGGLHISLTKAPSSQSAETAKRQVEEAVSKIEVTEQHLEAARSELEVIGSSALESGGQPDVSPATSATVEATASAQSAKSALEQIQGIVASLPENLRFSGLLVLVGAVLISVATVQFGGTSLF